MPKMTVTQFTVSLPNKPGQLAELTKYFADKGINLTGISVENLGDVACVRFVVPEREGEVQTWLESKGLRPTATKIFQVELPNQPGQIFQLADKLAQQNVNILNLYGSAYGRQAGCVWLSVDQPAKAQPILEKELLAAVS